MSTVLGLCLLSQQAVSNARAPLGALKSRKLESATRASRLPGAPHGGHMVLRFAATFDKKADAAETVTPMRETDGTFRVSGYLIR